MPWIHDVRQVVREKSSLYPVPCEYVPPAWPTSVPPVTFSEHPLADFSVLAPSMAAWRA